MNRLEQMTRAAAHAIGRDVTAYEWWDAVKGLRIGTVASGHWDAADCPVFAPLTDPCDAFVVEAVLQISVEYKCNGTSIGVWASCLKHPNMGYMTTVPTDVDASIAARMLVVTQFAALVDLVEGADDAQAA